MAKKDFSGFPSARDVFPTSEEKSSRLQQVETLKKMCRMLGRRRRKFLEEEWRRNAKVTSLQQFIHLMMVRAVLPCNLAGVMQMTGLTSAGASIFVNKMVKFGIFERQDDPHDRRNVIVRFTPEAAVVAAGIEDRLNHYIVGFFSDCTEEELAMLESVGELVNRTLGPEEDGVKFQTPARKHIRR